MFDGGVPAEQFHQFIAASRTTTSSSPSISLPLPLPLSSFPLHHHHHHHHHDFDPFITNNTNPNNPSTHYHNHLFPPLPLPQPPQHHHLFHQLHHKDDDTRHEEHRDEKEVVREHHHEHDNRLQSMAVNNLDIDDSRVSRSISEPWSSDEVIALLRVRSSTENWFPEITWEQVSRKLAEIGFKRSAEKCKEKFEEQSIRSIFQHNNETNNNINFSKNNNYGLLVSDELEDLYAPPPPSQNNPPQFDDKIVDKPGQEDQAKEDEPDKVDTDRPEDDSRTDQASLGHEDNNVVVVNKKRKIREGNNKRFDMFKGFCESVVEKLMAQQEEMHKKLLEDMVRRDKEMVEREEAWKKLEMERINKELDLRAHEQAIAGTRQATIIEFLKKFTSIDGSGNYPLLEMCTNSKDTCPNIVDDCSQTAIPSSPSNDRNVPEKVLSSVDVTLTEPVLASNHEPVGEGSQPNAVTSGNQDPSNNDLKNVPAGNPTIGKEAGGELGKRWPREEVLALINLRCSINGGSNEDRDHQGSVKAPLWERISLGMAELGYNRSAKRCKEKWENINKYFRKTKDHNVNKKRSLESRTCPYFHQLSALYSQGKIGSALENQPNSPESRKETTCPATGTGSGSQSQLRVGSDSTDTVQVAGSDKNVAQVPNF